MSVVGRCFFQHTHSRAGVCLFAQHRLDTEQHLEFVSAATCLLQMGRAHPAQHVASFSAPPEGRRFRNTKGCSPAAVHLPSNTTPNTLLPAPLPRHVKIASASFLPVSPTSLPASPSLLSFSPSSSAFRFCSTRRNLEDLEDNKQGQVQVQAQVQAQVQDQDQDEDDNLSTTTTEGDDEETDVSANDANCCDQVMETR